MKPIDFVPPNRFTPAIPMYNSMYNVDGTMRTLAEHRCRLQFLDPIAS